MNDTDPIQNKTSSPAPIDIDDGDTGAGRVFDISEDTISLVTDETVFPFAGEKKAAPVQASPVPVAQKTSGIPKVGVDDVRKSPPAKMQLDTENLLDKKFGSFDPSPFAKKTSVEPTIEPASIETAPIQAMTGETTQPVSSPDPLPGQTVLKQAQPTPIPIQDLTETINKIMGTQATQAGISPIIAANVGVSNPSTPNATSVTDNNSPKFGPDAQIKPNDPPVSPEGQTEQGVPVAQGIEALKMTDSILKPIRTYESDVAEVMSHKRTSAASIAIAENKKEEEGSEVISNNTPATPRFSSKKLFMLLMSFVLLGGGTVGAYYLYTKSPLAPPTSVSPQQQITANIVPADIQTVLTFDSTLPFALISRIQAEIAKPQSPNTIKEIIPAQKTEAGKGVRVTSTEMLELMDITIPDILSRSLTSDWMLGVYNTNENTKSVFVVVTTNFFQNTFAGMLQWEEVMADDLRPYLYPDTLRGISNTARNTNGGGVSTSRDSMENVDSVLPTTAQSSTTASTSSTPSSRAQATNPVTSTTSRTTSPAAVPGKTQSTSTSVVAEEAPLQSYFTLQGRFEDRIVKNKDVRAFRTEAGKILFLYSFIDNNHLIITNNETTLNEVLTRLEKRAFIR